MPKVSEAHLEARRAQIVAGARRAFATYGYDGATVARLEEETGLSRGAIFHYFRGKDDLFFAVSAELNNQLVDVYTRGGLEGAIEAVAELDPELLGMLIEVEARRRHDKAFQQRLEEQSEGARARLVEWFTERQRDGTFRDDVEMIHIGRFATTMINGLALRVAGGDAFDVAATTRLLNDALRPRQ